MTIAMHHDVCETNGFEILIIPSIFIHIYTQSYMIKLLVVRGDNHIIIKDRNNSNYY